MTVSPEPDNAREPARELYEQGFSLVAIARMLNVSVVSLLQWRQQDAGKGRTWSSTGIPQAGHPGVTQLQTPEDRLRAVISAQLRTHLARLARQALCTGGKGAAQRPAIEDRMLKVCRVIEHLNPATDDIMPQIVAMGKFADFCVRNLCEDEMPPVRKSVRLFLDDLKARHS